MINFRYHVVSLTAVFLALAIGLVVGTAALNGPVADSFKDQVSALSKDNSNFRAQANQYREELNRAQTFATEVAPALLNGKLTGRKLLLLGLPGSQDYVPPPNVLRGVDLGVADQGKHLSTSGGVADSGDQVARARGTETALAVTGQGGPSDVMRL